TRIAEDLFSVISWAARRIVTPPSQKTGGRETSSATRIVPSSGSAWTTCPVSTMRWRSEAARNPAPAGAAKTESAASRGSARHAVRSRALTVKAGARPLRREGCPKLSPGPMTSTTSLWWTSSTDPSTTTNRCSDGGPSSRRIVWPASYAHSPARSATARRASGSRLWKGAKRPRNSARAAVSIVSTIRRRFLSSRFLVIKAAFCQLAHHLAAHPKEAWMSANEQELDYAGGGLKQETNWWGAFVIGLAGTILVTGIAPVMVTSVGAASIPSIVIVTVSGWLLCLFLAELSAMMPERTGGSPSYAYPAFKDRWPRFAEHINGFTAWAYWLGWFPVGPLNMILASFYIVDKLNLSTSGFTPIHTPIAWWTLGISIVGLLLLFIPAYLGIRFGAMFATVLGLLSMIPLTFVAIAWIFKPSVV